METRVPPPVLGLAIAAAIWASTALWPETAFPAPVLRIAGYGLAGVGFLIDLTSVAAFFGRRTTITPLRPDKASALVVGGWYRISRNPMYLGMAMILAGWSLVLGAPAGVLGVAAFVWWITFWQILPEERALREKFGAEYDDYCARVRRWI